MPGIDRETTGLHQENPFNLPRNLETYSEDGRMAIEELYRSYEAFLEAGWKFEVVAQQTITTPDGKNLTFPVLAFHSQAEPEESTPTFWAMSGVHGEEPAGPMAFAHKIPHFIELAKKGIPMMVMPLMNPAGYHRDWRYENTQRNFKIGKSVTDSSQYLDDLRPILDSDTPSVAPSVTAQKVVAWIMDKLHVFHPEIVVDHHEDELESNPQITDPQEFASYSYFYGDPKFRFISEKITQILLDNGMSVAKNGVTRFGEVIRNGVVSASPDGSVDELFASPKYVDPQTKQVLPKPYTELGIVVETTRNNNGSITLAQRTKAQEEIIEKYEEFWQDKKTAA